MSRQLRGPGSTVIDAGANVGTRNEFPSIVAANMLILDALLHPFEKR